jgi:translation initiation factor 3 subunit I
MRPLILKGHERPVTIVRFNYDGDLFFSGSAENKINLWEAYTGERLGSYDTKASVRSLDVDINSQYLVACSNDGSLEVTLPPCRSST